MSRSKRITKRGNGLATSSKNCCTAITQAGGRCKLRVYKNGLCGSHDFAAKPRVVKKKVEVKKVSAQHARVERVNFRSLVEYEIHGVALGVKSKVEAYDSLVEHLKRSSPGGAVDSTR